MIAAGRTALAVAAVAAWEVLHRTLGAEWLSSPIAVVARVIELVTSGELARHATATAIEAGVGFALGAGAGVVVPFVLHRSPRLTVASAPFFAAAMAVPKLALAPVIILWFGIGIASKVAVVAGVVFFLLFFNTLAGVQSVDARLAATLRVLGAAEWTVTREVVWHTALPNIFAGLKLALPRAISAAVVAEFLAADRGLGFYINNARAMADTVGLFAGVVVVTALVVVLDAGLERLQARSLAWRPVASDVGV